MIPIMFLMLVLHLIPIPRMTVVTSITFSLNKTVACVDLSNYTQISNVTVKPVPQPDIVIPPIPSGNDTTAAIIIITPTQPPPQSTQSTGMLLLYKQQFSLSHKFI